MIEHILTHTLPAAYSLLPAKMQSPEATAMLLAIGLQESHFITRTQHPDGPARGFWQFERAGLSGVVRHPSTTRACIAVCEALCYQPITSANLDLFHRALQHNDTLACCVARLLLWTLPGRLARRGEPDIGWDDYLKAWRPGKPHRETWDAHYAAAWDMVTS